MSEEIHSHETLRSDDFPNDPRLTLIYHEARRGLEHQEGLVEGLGNRAASLIFATAFASSLLGGIAVADGVGAWEWIALGLLLAIGAMIAFMLWPFYNYTFRLDPVELLERFVDVDEPASLSTMHRKLALRLEEFRQCNWRTIRRLRIALQWR